MLFKVILWLFVCLAILFVLAVVLLYFLQEKLIFFPEKLPQEHAFEFEIPHTEEFFTMADGTRIHALHFTPDTPKGWIFYLHGNAGSLRTWGERALEFYRRDYACTMMDYRGYGKSEGKIGPDVIFTDAEEIFEQIRERRAGMRTVIYGCSLGTGIAAHLAASKDCDLLVLETPYYNLGDISAQHYPFIPHNLLLRYPMRTDRIVAGVKAPIAMIHGTHDEVIYYGSSLKLKEKVKRTDLLFTIPDGKHSNLSDYPEFHMAYNQLFK